jgi:hypothetical protein
VGLSVKTPQSIEIDLMMPASWNNATAINSRQFIGVVLNHNLAVSIVDRSVAVDPLNN